MQRNFYLSLVLMTLLSFIIISGCGGDNSGVTSISSISTPTHDSSVPAGGAGYITMKIIWPQGGQEGKCIISSEDNNEKDIIASMPVDIASVVVNIYDKTDNTNTPLTNGTHEFIWANAIKEEKHTFGPLPAIRVIVKADAFFYKNGVIITDPNNVLHRQNEIQILPGTKNEMINFNFGRTYMNSKAVPVYPARDSSLI